MEILLLSNSRLVLSVEVEDGHLLTSNFLAEEKALIRFFGDEYVQYRARTWTWIPFVP
jgi:protein-S-isoprenylcysteine O-methyltransferase